MQTIQLNINISKILLKKGTNKSNKKYKSTGNTYRTELLKIIKNQESSFTNKTSNNKNDNKNAIDNSSKRNKKIDKIYKYVQNC